MIEILNRLNDVVIYPVAGERFKTYGRIIDGYDFTDLIAYMEQETAIPDHGNVYLPSIKTMEDKPIRLGLRDSFYGGMEIQIGYCNGQNTTYNGFEYHKGSEINIAVTDFMLVLGHIWEIKKKTYQIEDAEVFFVERGTAIEMYQTTLHLSPCKVNEEGFKNIVILPKGTNTPLVNRESPIEEEGELLLLRNKWVIAHQERLPLISQGAYPGLLGENKELYYK